MSLEAKYDRLTPAERVRCALAANARRDRAEFDRLFRTAPTATYRMADAAVLDRWDVLYRVAVTFFAVYHQAHWRWVLLLERRDERMRAGRRWSNPEAEDLGAAWLGVASASAALESFCAAAGVKAADLLRASFGMFADEILEVRDRFKDYLHLPSVQEDAAPLLKLFLARWPDAPQAAGPDTEDSDPDPLDAPALLPAGNGNGAAPHA